MASRESAIFVEKTLKAGVYRLLSSYGRYLHREGGDLLAGP